MTSHPRHFTRATTNLLWAGRGKWKKNYDNHKVLFNHKRYSRDTTLSSYLWNLKESSDVTLNMKWSVVRCVTPYSNISKKRFLCLYEKLVIIRQHELLNKRWELFCKCPHENKYLLKNFRINDNRHLNILTEGKTLID